MKNHSKKEKHILIAKSQTIKNTKTTRHLIKKTEINIFRIIANPLVTLLKPQTSRHVSIKNRLIAIKIISNSSSNMENTYIKSCREFMYFGITCDLANERQNKINVYKLF